MNLKLSAALSVTLCMLFASSVSATVFNAHSEFSDSNNPNGVWSYRSLTANAATGPGIPSVDSLLLDEFSQLPNFPTVFAWHPTGQDFSSIEARALDHLLSHPSSSNDAMVMFTLPAIEGPVFADLVIDIADGDPTNAGDGSVFHVFANDQKIGGAIVLPTFAAFTLEFDNLMLNPGDTLSYVHDEGGFGASNVFDGILFDLTVTTTPKSTNTTAPEPTSIALLALGLTVLGVTRKRLR